MRDGRLTWLVTNGEVESGAKPCYHCHTSLAFVHSVKDSTRLSEAGSGPTKPFVRILGGVGLGWVGLGPPASCGGAAALPST